VIVRIENASLASQAVAPPGIGQLMQREVRGFQLIIRAAQIDRLIGIVGAARVQLRT
jgi:hypothetical protein